ncbi:hypothetical protein CH302_27500 [Rhodococcus sp. 15-2388-1-1a]|uniref:SGNH/GDSL hydrolase family protein n=1 Tax=Rhodococcus sp. 15-2388-1-1a TaxID=2023142 RepID=UPI000B9A37DE|nr:SGNH/GDSL hydrolase family protein [Rhodococcus sp. 15-2388-1-1a]OZE90200.1 hypothetical protein CH302_27500 [Rhodococcus sp. 15-2388-1-1a]
MTSPVLQYGRVEDWIGGLVMDGLDSDDLPDDVALTGSVKLEPMLAESAGGIRVPTMPKWLSVQPVTCQYVNGRLTHRGLPYVMLLAPNEATNPTNWKWQASFDLRLNGAQVVRKQFAFVLPVYDPDAALVAGRNPTIVNLTTVQPVNVPGSGTGVVQGPAGFSLSGVEIVEDGIQFYREAPGEPGGQVPVGVPVPLPAGSGEVPADSIDAAKLAPALREKVESAITDTEADERYTPVLTADVSRPGLYFFSGAAADGELAAASSVYRSAALASGSSRLKLLALMDSTGDGFGNPGGPDQWSKVWPLKLAELLRTHLGRPAGGRGWVPVSNPLAPGSYVWRPSTLLPTTATATDPLGSQIGIPGSLWLQRGHATNVDEVRWTLSAGVTSVDVVHTGYGASDNGLVITAANTAASVTKNSIGDRVVTRITNPGATIDVHGAPGVGLAALGIVEYVGDENAGVTMWNLSQGSMAAHEYAAWITDGAFSLRPMIGSYAPHVALVCLGANDYSRARTTTQVTTALETIRSSIASVSPGTVTVFVLRPVDPAMTTEQAPTATWAQFCTAIQSYAAGVGAPVLDLRSSVPASGGGLYLGDKVHWTEAGQNAAAAAALDYMKVGV